MQSIHLSSLDLFKGYTRAPFIFYKGRGKTSLVAAIQGKGMPENISTVGISIEQFVLPVKQKSMDIIWVNNIFSI